MLAERIDSFHEKSGRLDTDFPRLLGQLAETMTEHACATRLIVFDILKGNHRARF
jgi:hypothetical protein